MVSHRFFLLPAWNLIQLDYAHIQKYRTVHTFSWLRCSPSQDSSHYQHITSHCKARGFISPCYSEGGREMPSPTPTRRFRASYTPRKIQDSQPEKITHLQRKIIWTKPHLHDFVTLLITMAADLVGFMSVFHVLLLIFKGCRLFVLQVLGKNCPLFPAADWGGNMYYFNRSSEKRRKFWKDSGTSMILRKWCWLNIFFGEIYGSICLLDAMVLASMETMTHDTRNVEDPSKGNLRVGRLEGMSTPLKGAWQ